MRISIIGSGHVAHILAWLLYKHNYTIVEIIGRNKDAVHTLATTVQAKPCTDFSQVDMSADIYIVSVSDNAILDVLTTIQLPKNKILLHTAGSVSMQVLAAKTDYYGVLYPLQSIRKENKYLLEQEMEIPFLIDASNEATFRVVEALAQQLSTKVERVNDYQRIQMHIAAVFATNFVNYMYLLSEKYCQQQHLDFSLLLPLIQETAKRLHHFSPQEVMTGPAVRQDTSTIDKHMQLLATTPMLQDMYMYLTQQIIQYAQKLKNS